MKLKKTTRFYIVLLESWLEKESVFTIAQEVDVCTRTIQLSLNETCQELVDQIYLNIRQNVSNFNATHAPIDNDTEFQICF